MDKKTCYIVLEDGHVMEGQRFGAEGTATGELVFTTGVVGYIETLTDPGYAGQIVVQTFPLIGNYGMIAEDCSGSAAVKGYIVREWCEEPSNFRCDETIDAYLKKQGVVGVCGVDTRELTQIIREHGVMNAVLTEDPDTVDIEALKTYRVAPVQRPDRAQKTEYPVSNARFHVAMPDYGAAYHLIEALGASGCSVTVYPASASAQEILADKPDGILLPNGPGDPKDYTFETSQIQQMLGKVPMLGICLGHQLLALANGAQTEKLKHGHRGSNQPVKRLKDGKMFIASQNHGYVVTNDSIQAASGTVSYVNANDGTCEGAEYPAQKAISAQFYPEICEGKTDGEGLLAAFITLMGGASSCR